MLKLRFKVEPRKLGREEVDLSNGYNHQIHRKLMMHVRLLSFVTCDVCCLKYAESHPCNFP